jgi:hypothetical protein
LSSLEKTEFPNDFGRGAAPLQAVGGFAQGLLIEAAHNGSGHSVKTHIIGTEIYEPGCLGKEAVWVEVRLGDEEHRPLDADATLSHEAIEPETREDHAAYIASWLKVLKDDKRAIFTAASHAQKAAGYLNGLQPQQDSGASDSAMREAA